MLKKNLIIFNEFNKIHFLEKNFTMYLKYYFKFFKFEIILINKENINVSCKIIFYNHSLL